MVSLCVSPFSSLLRVCIINNRETGDALFQHNCTNLFFFFFFSSSFCLAWHGFTWWWLLGQISFWTNPLFRGVLVLSFLLTICVYGVYVCISYVSNAFRRSFRVFPWYFVHLILRFTLGGVTSSEVLTKPMYEPLCVATHLLFSPWQASFAFVCLCLCVQCRTVRARCVCFYIMKQLVHDTAHARVHVAWLKGQTLLSICAHTWVKANLCLIRRSFEHIPNASEPKLTLMLNLHCSSSQTIENQWFRFVQSCWTTLRNFAFYLFGLDILIQVSMHVC